MNYFNQKSGRDLTPIFHQYLQYAAIPRLVYTLKKVKGKKYELIYFWLTDVKDFNMPVQIITGGGRTEWIPVSNAIQTKTLTLSAESDFRINEDLEYIKVEKR